MSFFTSLFGTNTQENDAITILDKSAFASAIATGDVQLVDVRTPREFQGGFIKNAVNIDFFNQNTFKQAFEQFNKEKPLYLYCRSGNRSQKAAQKLIEMGFKEIYDLKGGYLAW